jgi:hypothetical protein
MTYRDWSNPGIRQSGISEEDLKKPAAASRLFQGRAIPACRKPELMGILNLLSGH